MEQELLFPTQPRTEMTARAHSSHLGIQYTTSTARDIMNWPRMTADLTEAVQKCHVCQQSKPALLNRSHDDLPDSKPTMASCC